jgi:hypothetical protein
MKLYSRITLDSIEWVVGDSLFEDVRVEATSLLDDGNNGHLSVVLIIPKGKDPEPQVPAVEHPFSSPQILSSSCRADDDKLLTMSAVEHIAPPFPVMGCPRWWVVMIGPLAPMPISSAALEPPASTGWASPYDEGIETNNGIETHIPACYLARADAMDASERRGTT